MNFSFNRYLRVNYVFYDRLERKFVSNINDSEKLKIIDMLRKNKKISIALDFKLKSSRLSKLLSHLYGLFSITFTVIILCTYSHSYNLIINQINLIQMVYCIPICAIISLFLHEFSHAVIAHFQNAIVVEIGLDFKKKSPKYYTKIFWLDNSMFLSKLSFYFAGVATHLYIFDIFIILYKNNNSNFILTSIIINLSFVIINLLPFEGSDGLNLIRLIINKNNHNKTD